MPDLTEPKELTELAKFTQLTGDGGSAGDTSVSHAIVAQGSSTAVAGQSAGAQCLPANKGDLGDVMVHVCV